MPAISSTASDPPSWDSIVPDYESRVEPFTASFVEEMLEPFRSIDKKNQEKIRLLDVGCGTGAVTLRAREMGFNVAATDISSAMVKRLRERHDAVYGPSESNLLEGLAADGQELPDCWENQFDYAVGAFSVIFFPNVPRGLQQIRKCLVPGSGRAVVSAWGTPEETPAFRVFPDALQSIAPHKSVSIKRITGSPSTLTSLLEDAGFEGIQIIGPVKRILRVSSSEAFYERFALGSPHTATTISDLTKDEQVQLKAKVMELAEARGGGRSDGVIEMSSNAYFAYGTKPLSSEKEL